MEKSSMNRYALILTAAIIAVTLVASVSTLAPASAFPHALKIVEVDVHGHHKEVLIVIGHTNEPTFGSKSGLHDGKHHVEVFLEDAETALPISGAQLKVDKYYFKTLTKFSNSNTVNQANKIQTDIQLGGVFGDPGHYIARQIQSPGIYGYRLHGTIDYFGEGTLNINETIFCTLSEGGGGSQTAKFNTPGWFGGFGCTGNINDITFPPKTAASSSSLEETAVNSDDSEIYQTGFNSGTMVTVDYKPLNEEKQSAPALQALLMGVSGVALAGFFGVKRLRNQKRHQQF
jgi:hypothetical protein